MRALIVSSIRPDPRERRILCGLTSGIRSEPSCARARRAMNSTCPSVVVTSEMLPGGTWYDILQLTRAPDDAPPLVVTTRQPDESLQAEVLNPGGFDLRARPFGSREVSRVVGFAVNRCGQLAAAGAIS